MDVLRPIEAERGVIVGAIAGREEQRKMADSLSPEDFSSEDAQRVFRAIQAIRTRRETVDLMSVDTELTRMYGAQTTADIMQFVMSAMRNGGTLQTWQTPRYVEMVREASSRRLLISIGESLTSGASDPQRDIAELSDETRTALRNSSRSAGGWFSAADAVLSAYEAAEKCEKPIATGIRELDAIMCGGLHMGEFTIIGARPAVGKSALLLSMALTAAKNGAHVCFASLEMSRLQLGARILAAKSGFKAAMLRMGEELPSDAWTELSEALLAVGDDGVERLSFLVNGSLTVEQLRQEAQNLVDNGLCDLLIVDYLQLLSTKRKTNSDLERLEAVSRGLKSITLDCGVAVVAAAQLRRQNNIGVPRAPTIDELRGSGSLEQDADNVILMHRPEFSDDDVLKGQAYKRVAGAYERGLRTGLQLISLDVCKQRQGRTARAWTLFDGSRMQYHEPSEV